METKSVLNHIHSLPASKYKVLATAAPYLQSSKMKSQIILVAALVVCGGIAVRSQEESDSFGEILVSTLKIVNRLCNCPTNRYSQTKIDAFFACYDDAPGKDLFEACQTKLFGGPLNNVANVGVSCRQPYKLPAYALCISQKFKAAGLDMNAAVTKLNACQSDVLGIKS